MRLLIDEDTQSYVLRQLLREAGHDVMTAQEAGLNRHRDAEILAFARQEHRAVLTRNVDDFTALHRIDPNHFGILQIYQGQMSSKNMQEPEIVRAIANIEAAGWDIAGQCVSLMGWDY